MLGDTMGRVTPGAPEGLQMWAAARRRSWVWHYSSPSTLTFNTSLISGRAG